MTRIDLGGGAWADLHPCWDDEYGWSLLIETDEPEWVDLWEVYQHFRRKEMTAKEWWQEFDREMAKGKIFDLEKENAAMGYELNQLRAPTGSAIPLIPALADLASIAKSLARIADVVDPPPPDKVDTATLPNDLVSAWRGYPRWRARVKFRRVASLQAPAKASFGSSIGHELTSGSTTAGLDVPVELHADRDSDGEPRCPASPNRKRRRSPLS